MAVALNKLDEKKFGVDLKAACKRASIIFIKFMEKRENEADVDFCEKAIGDVCNGCSDADSA